LALFSHFLDKDASRSFSFESFPFGRYVFF
jgi:hypothetical protein